MNLTKYVEIYNLLVKPASGIYIFNSRGLRVESYWILTVASACWKLHPERALLLSGLEIKPRTLHMLASALPLCYIPSPRHFC
jgi:hypothetical protein